MKKIIDTQEDFDKLVDESVSSGVFDKFSLIDAEINCHLVFSQSIFPNYDYLLSFENVIFNKNFTFKLHKNNRVGQVSFLKCLFNFSLDFRHYNFNSLEIIDSIFKKNVDFSNSDFFSEVHLINNTFITNIKFEGCCYYEKATFIYNIIGEKAFFRSSKFHKNADFSENSFNSGVDFAHSTFNGTFVSRGLKSVNDMALFSSVIFNNDVFLTQSRFYGGITLFASLIKQDIDISDIKVFGENTDSETFRIIKNIFLKNNNKIQALVFYEKEMEAYRKELVDARKFSKGRLPKLKNTNTLKPEVLTVDNVSVHNEILLKERHILECDDITKTYRRDIAILCLNKISNNYGLSWKQGLKFVLISSLIGYILYIFSFMVFGTFPYKLGWNGWGEFGKGFDYVIGNYFQFLWPTHKFDFMKGIESSSLSYFIDVLSRIIIGFGIYQMVQAFRKFGK